MTMQSVTLQLPEPVFRYLQQMAVATKRPLEQVVRQSVEELPPSVVTMPLQLHHDLLALQGLQVEQLLAVAAEQATPADQARHLELLELNSAGDLTGDEAKELAALRLAADRIMLSKAYAWSVLRWRGIEFRRSMSCPWSNCGYATELSADDRFRFGGTSLRLNNDYVWPSGAVDCPSVAPRG